MCYIYIVLPQKMPIMTSSFEKPNLVHLEALIQSPALSKQEKIALKSYRKMIDEKTNEVIVEYTVDTCGRFQGYAKQGKKKTYTTGTSMKRVIRNILFGEDYDDLDIANCSGNIMCQLFEKHNLLTDKMSYLNNNREAVLQDIMKFHSQKIERSSAKDMLIEVFFCGSGRSSQYWELNPFTKEKKDTIIQYALPPFVEQLKQEYIRNLNHIVDLPEYKPIVDYVVNKAEKIDKSAWIGQFASQLYQDEERKVLSVIQEEIQNIAKDRRIEHAIGSLIYDGLHVKKTLEIRNYIKRIEKAISRKSDYMLHLEIKDMEVSPEEKLKYIGEKQIEISYEGKRALFERSRFKTHKGRFPFHTIDIETIVSRDKSSFLVAYEDWIEDGADFMKAWFADPHKRAYEEIEYACVKDEDKKTNVYYAFPTLRFKTLTSMSSDIEREANIEFFKDYVKLLVEDNDNYIQWMTYWIADILLNPDTKGAQPISIIMWSEPGAGKTSLRQLMTMLLGNKLVHHTEDPTRNGDILHDFNSTLKYKLFIEFEEIQMKTHSQCNDRIKALITNHTHTITAKGQDSIDVKATERTIMTTNTSSSAYLDKGDRRYAAFHVSTRRVNDTIYWTEFYKKMHDDSFLRDIADYLMSMKEAVNNYAFRDERPITAYYNDLQQLSLAPELDFMKDLFFYDSHDIQFYEAKDIKNFFKIPSTELYNLYNQWRVKQNMKEPITNKSYTMKMNSHGAKYGIKNVRTAECSQFWIDATKLKEELKKDFNMPSDTKIESNQKCLITA